MNDELKQLIEDAAKLLGLSGSGIEYAGGVCLGFRKQDRTFFAPCDPERGDLMRVAEAAELTVDFEFYTVTLPVKDTDCFPEEFDWIRGDHASKVLAILRAASAVYKSRGGVR